MITIKRLFSKVKRQSLYEISHLFKFNNLRQDQYLFYSLLLRNISQSLYCKEAIICNVTKFFWVGWKRQSIPNEHNVYLYEKSGEMSVKEFNGTNQINVRLNQGSNLVNVQINQGNLVQERK